MTRTNRRPASLTRITAIGALVLSCFASGSAVGQAIHLHDQAPAPARCHVASSWLPSGDAIEVDQHGNAWTAGSKVTGPVVQYVCTGGRWIHITGYGNAVKASTTAAGGWYAQDNATCAAFRAYLRHGTEKRFKVMLTDSRTALHYLRIDVAWWQKDRKDHANAAELATDRAFVSGDCTDPAAQMDS